MFRSAASHGPWMPRHHQDHRNPSSQHAALSSSMAQTPSPGFRLSETWGCQQNGPPLSQRQHIFRKRGNVSSGTARATSNDFRCRGGNDVRTQHGEDTWAEHSNTTAPWTLSPMEKALPETPVASPRSRKQWPYSLATEGPAKVAGLVDAHCHLELLFGKAGHDGTYARFRLQHQDTFPDCYEGCVTSFSRPAAFKQCSMWNKLLDEAGVWGAFGCHPQMAREYNRQVEESLLHALNHPSVVALGEVGLDYSKRGCDPELQQKVFRTQIGLALSRKLPLIIHSRDSTRDTISIMREMLPPDYPIHRHCFTGSWGEAQEWLQAFPNLCLGLTPLVTFKSVGDQPITEAARNIPLDRLLLETDSPYFLPGKETRRLKQSHPGMVIHVATHLSRLRNVAVEEILAATRENVRRIYGI